MLSTASVHSDVLWTRVLTMLLICSRSDVSFHNQACPLVLVMFPLNGRVIGSTETIKLWKCQRSRPAPACPEVEVKLCHKKIKSNNKPVKTSCCATMQVVRVDGPDGWGTGYLSPALDVIHSRPWHKLEKSKKMKMLVAETLFLKPAKVPS